MTMILVRNKSSLGFGNRTPLPKTIDHSNLTYQPTTTKLLLSQVVRKHLVKVSLLAATLAFSFGYFVGGILIKRDR